MRAVVCKEFGPPEKLVIEDIETPVPGPGQVRIDVEAAAVTFPDCLLIEDKYQFKAAPPFVPGGEVGGVISALGSGVDGLEVGDRVVGSLGLVGGFAEQAVASASGVRVVPDSAGLGESTGLLYAYGTGYYGLKHRGQLQAGETLLVLGAGGNVGIAAVELGVLMGARVIAAASSDEKLALCRERGAAMTINYRSEKLKDRAKELTEGKGVDVVYDAVGGDYAESALRAISWGGRFLVIGFTAGIPKLPLNLALLKGCQIIGVFLGGMLSREPEIRDGIVRDLLEFTASGKLNPQVSKRYSLDEAPQALRDLMDRKAVGKVVIAP